MERNDAALSLQLVAQPAAFVEQALRNVLTCLRAGEHQFADDVKAGIVQDFLHGVIGAAGFAGQPVERPYRRTGRDDDGPFAFMQRNGNASPTLTHHSRHDAVEDEFHLSAHVPPVDRRPHDEGFAPAYFLGHAMTVIGGQHAGIGGSAPHATRTGMHMQVVHVYPMYLSPFERVYHSVKHRCHRAMPVGTAVDDENLHSCANKRSAIALPRSSH